ADGISRRLPVAGRGGVVVPPDRRRARPDRGDRPLARLQSPAETAVCPHTAAGRREAMNCTVLQRRLLELEQPDRPPPEVRAHLAAFPVCRRGRRRLVQIDQRVPLTPVPPSGRKSAVLRCVLAEPAAAAKESTPVERPKLRPFLHGAPPRDRAPKKIALATALAA